MMMAGPRPRMLFVLDLDFTHFNSHAPLPTWLGTKEAWLAFYQQCVEIAGNDGVELVFAVVTNKKQFDDIAEEAAKAFEPLLSIANADMYIEGSKLNWCLIKHDDTLKYECLTIVKTKKCLFTNVFSHFVIEPIKNKTPHILDIANRHDISPEHILLLDDTPLVLLDAMLQGIQTVSFEEFCPDNLTDLGKLNDPTFVEPILLSKREQILTKFCIMLDDLKAKNQPPPLLHMNEDALSHFSPYPVDEKWRTLMDQYDPRDCLHSWGSFRLLLGEANEPLTYSIQPSIRLK
jgi:hypothetical protein